jgi:hypothetical protein
MDIGIQPLILKGRSKATFAIYPQLIHKTAVNESSGVEAKRPAVRLTGRRRIIG